MLNLYNTLAGRTELFNPIEDKEVKMYTCGPSTYMRPHIGNLRTFLYEDILERYFEYLGYKVTRLMTLTDVEDKAIAEAKKENITIEELTNRNEKLLCHDFEFLRIEIPNYMVRASTVVYHAVRMIKVLILRGYAYWHNHDRKKNVYFDPLGFQGFGKLAKLDMSHWPKRRKRFHKDTYPGTPWNKGDFILWHGCAEDDACWETEIGRGRPAWNLQDAAIVTKHLGYTLDVAAGGIDNLARHHDYTIAVAEAVSGKQFARYWLHGGHLFVNGKKMSKSKGNVYYVSDIAAKGYEGTHLRFFLIYRNYRKRLNFTWEKLAKKSHKLNQFKIMVQDLKKAKSSSNGKAKLLIAKIVSNFERNMNNDLNVKAAFDAVFAVVVKLQQLKKNDCMSAEEADVAINKLKDIDRVLKVIF